MRIGVLVAFAAILALSGVASNAADDHKIGVEFNDLQQGDAGCRAVFVLHNGLDRALDQLTMRIVAFDGKNHATLFLSLDVGALPIEKTRVLRFDLGNGVSCGNIGRLVLDDVTDCKGTDMTPAKCLGLITLSSRAGVAFDF